jgi:hypothetical protein
MNTFLLINQGSLNGIHNCELKIYRRLQCQRLVPSFLTLFLPPWGWPLLVGSCFCLFTQLRMKTENHRSRSLLQRNMGSNPLSPRSGMASSRLKRILVLPRCADQAPSAWFKRKRQSASRSRSAMASSHHRPLSGMASSPFRHRHSRIPLKQNSTRYSRVDFRPPTRPNELRDPPPMATRVSATI